MSDGMLANRPKHLALSTPVTFNGRFLRARPTGVQRVARELLTALDGRLSKGGQPERDLRLVGPAGTSADWLEQIAFCPSGGLPGQAWEQLELPRTARGTLLVNLCNTAPLLGGPMLTMVHDAQVFITPESYRKTFAAWYRFALPRIANRSMLLLTVSEYSAGQLVGFGIGRRDQIRVIPNGVDHLSAIKPDPSILSQHGLVPNSYVVALASHQPHKNTKVLLRAFADGAMGGLRLVLVGSVDPKAYMQSGLPIGATTSFVGSVSDSVLKALVENAVCLACPSTTEGFGLPPLEAMAQGRPVVVAPCGALPEVCGDAALYADPKDVQLWQTQIKLLWEDQALWREYAQRGSVRAAPYTWDNAAQRLMDVIEEVAPSPLSSAQ